MTVVLGWFGSKVPNIYYYFVIYFHRNNNNNNLQLDTILNNEVSA
jgi:hypothetical protein